eukprot:2591017-Prymnesium_polylepis.1
MPRAVCARVGVPSGPSCGVGARPHVLQRIESRCCARSSRCCACAARSVCAPPKKQPLSRVDG